MIRASDNFIDGFRELNKIAKQVPFATARALTWTAVDAREELRSDLPNQFELRNKWTEKGINIRSATKRKLQAEVGTRDWYMPHHETGYTRKPKSARHIAVPTKAIKRTKTGKISKAKKPAQLLKKQTKIKPFVGRSERGGNLFIAKRQGKDSYPIDIYYFLTYEAEMKASWNFEDSTEKVVKSRIIKNFNKSLGMAIATVW